MCRLTYRFVANRNHRKNFVDVLSSQPLSHSLVHPHDRVVGLSRVHRGIGSDPAPGARMTCVVASTLRGDVADLREAVGVERCPRVALRDDGQHLRRDVHLRHVVGRRGVRLDRLERLESL